MGGNALLHAENLLHHAGVAPGMHVVDFGCGQSGHLVFPAGRMVGEEGRVYGVDIRPDIVETLTNHCAHTDALNVYPVQGDFERPDGVPIASGSVDRIFLVNSLWVVNDSAALFQEARRLLKDDGMFVLVDWYKRAEHPVAPPMHARTDLVKAMRLAASHGISGMQDLSLGRTHWALITQFA